MAAYPPHRTPSEAANCSDLGQVLVCFQDPQVSLAFSYFLSALGLEPVIADSSRLPANPRRVITEAKFYPLLSSEQQSLCLLVGNEPGEIASNAIVLSQPLTEEKIDTALHTWLK